MNNSQEAIPRWPVSHSAAVRYSRFLSVSPPQPSLSLLQPSTLFPRLGSFFLLPGRGRRGWKRDVERVGDRGVEKVSWVWDAMALRSHEYLTVQLFRDRSGAHLTPFSPPLLFFISLYIRIAVSISMYIYIQKVRG